MQTILIVDDEPNIVEGLASQLQQNYGDRAIVLRAYSGTHALSILRENQVDVVLSDICMPDLDGLSLMEETESLWPRAHFIFLSGFDDFQYIHRASKSPLYRGYLLKMEGDEVVLQKVDQEIRLCEEEARAELEQEEARRQVERMQAFLQRAALESVLRGGSAWAHMADRFPHGFSGLETSAPVILILGKVRQRTVSDTLDMLVKIDRLLALRLTRFRFVSLLPEEGAPVWLMQRGGVLEAADASYLYALFESIQQRLAETEGAHVSFVVGSACGLAEIAEKYTLVKRIYAFFRLWAGSPGHGGRGHLCPAGAGQKEPGGRGSSSAFPSCSSACATPWKTAQRRRPTHSWRRLSPAAPGIRRPCARSSC